MRISPFGKKSSSYTDDLILLTIQCIHFIRLSQWSCTDVRVGLWRNLNAEKLMLLNCDVGEDSWESLGLQGNQSWVFIGRTDAGAETPNTLATSCEEVTHWKRLWCWEGLGAGGEGDDRGWDGWMASPTRWAWVWVNSRGWWWTGRPGVLRFMGPQRVGHDWATELNLLRKVFHLSFSASW